MRNKDKSVKYSCERKKTFCSYKYTNSLMLGSLRQLILIDKAGSITSFSSKHAFSSVILCAKNIENFF